MSSAQRPGAGAAGAGTRWVRGGPTEEPAVVVVATAALVVGVNVVELDRAAGGGREAWLEHAPIASTALSASTARLTAA